MSGLVLGITVKRHHQCPADQSAPVRDHQTVLIDPDQPAELEEAKRLSHRMAERALRLGGTCTGEHGVGMGKLPYMEAEHGAGWDVMGEIKQALDPLGILNPGKLVRQG